MDRIKQGFKQLGINESMYPEYKDAASFASGFKKCSILKDSNITYSSSSIIQKSIKAKDK